MLVLTTFLQPRRPARGRQHRLHHVRQQPAALPSRQSAEPHEKEQARYFVDVMTGERVDSDLVNSSTRARSQSWSSQPATCRKPPADRSAGASSAAGSRLGCRTSGGSGHDRRAPTAGARRTQGSSRNRPGLPRDGDQVTTPFHMESRAHVEPGSLPHKALVTHGHLVTPRATTQMATALQIAGRLRDAREALSSHDRHVCLRRTEPDHA